MKKPATLHPTEKRGLRRKTLHAVRKISIRGKTREQLRRHVLVELAVFVVVAIAFIFFIRHDLNERPGILDRSELVATERTTNSITLGWNETRNTDNYQLFVKQRGSQYVNWKQITIENSEEEPITSYTLDELQEGTEYCFIMRADSDEREGFKTDTVYYSTKTAQTIEVPYSNITKLTTSKAFKLNAKADTTLSYYSSNNKVVTVSDRGKVRVNGKGTATISITAAENKDYVESKKDVYIRVLEDADRKASTSDVKVIYTLDDDNCEALFSIHTSGTPQSFAYTGDKYIVAYNGGFNGVVTYSDKGNKLSTKSTSALGHANGFTYCDATGLCYGMRGGSHRMDSYDPKTGAFGTTSSGYGGAGIAYDRADKVIYLSSRAGVRVLTADGKFHQKKMIGSVSHSGHVYTQDCGGHAGIVMRCISGSNKHGTNYIDMYRVDDGTYIGSLFTDIGEVESAIVDKDGFLVLLINSSGDYIWRTPINIETLAEK